MRSPWLARAVAVALLLLPFLFFPGIPAGSGPGRAPVVAAMAGAADPAVLQVDHSEVAVKVSRSSAAPTSISWPAPGAITSPFGDHRNHPGIDIDGETGDPVLAAGNGTVTMAGQAPGGFGGYGIVVAIDHGGGLMTLYAHLSKVAVSMGQPVLAGQLIGAIGMTGLATGSHLHFELRVAGKPVDPMPWLPARPTTRAPAPPAPALVAEPAPRGPFE
jgi:murein DD-endopeptidase MepM/ murein hydrolase activator NlpD